MKLKDILQVLSAGGVSLDPKSVALFVLVAAALVGAGVKGYKWWQQRRSKSAPPPSPIAAPGAATSTLRPLSARQLRASFSKFLVRLPRAHRRSILNFEHFLLMGPPSSGKSRLIDTQTDWAYQMRQVARPGSVEADFPAVLASGAIVAELPSSLLDDSSQSTRAALNGLWRRVYRRRAPTVVAVLDTTYLARSTRDEVVRVMRAVRMRANQLSAIRGRAVEIRVALTHMDQLPGFDAVARFWTDQGISSQIQLAREGALADSLREWSNETRTQLPRALSSQSSDDFRRVLAFMRTADHWLKPLEQALEVLYAREPTSLDPVRGGVYLCSEVAGSANPLRNAHERGRGPDPTRRHLIGVTAGTSAALTFFAMAFLTQRAEWRHGIRAFSAYHVTPTSVDTPSELVMRRDILAFAEGGEGLTSTFPPFFAGAREQMAEQFATKLRNDLLIPHLNQTVLAGALKDSHGNTLRWRRAVYMLAILHSDQDDRLRIHERERLDLFTKMTGLRPGTILDYLRTSRLAYAVPISFELQETPNAYDQAQAWLQLPEATAAALADGLIRPEELSQLKRLAEARYPALARFEYDEQTMDLLDNLSAAAASTAELAREARHLQAHYTEQFDEVVGICRSNRIHELHGVLGQLLSLIRDSSLDVTLMNDGSAPIAKLVTALRVLQAEASPRAAQGRLSFELAGRSAMIDPARWRDVLASSRAQALVEEFLASSRGTASPFFAMAEETRLPPVEWNAAGSAATLFVGRATLRGRYTAVGFERSVKTPLKDLGELLTGVALDPGSLQALRRQLLSAVSAYAQEYTAESQRFLAAFRVHAPTAEALRVVLGQVAAESSSFDDFVGALDMNTYLDLTAAAPDPAQAVVPTAGEAAPAASASVAAAAPTNPTTAPAVASATGPSSQRSGFTLEELLAPMQTVLDEFEPWHRAVGAAGGGAELAKYKEIAAQLLTDLSNAEAAADAETPGLEAGLSAAGRASLSSFRATTGAYRQLVEQWALASGLPPAQRRPFLAPFQQLSRLGTAEVDDLVGRVWREEMLPLVRSVTSKFPFDPRSREPIDPEELEAILHPTKGAFFQLFRSYLEPVSAFGDGQAFRPLPSSNGMLRPPGDLYPTVNAVAALAARLWDAEGNPKPLSLSVAPVPFATHGKDSVVPTVVQLNVGASSVFNFNQKPTMTELAIAWTEDEPAQLAVQAVDVETRETFHPAALSADGPHWRFFRLLAAGKRLRDADGHVYEWHRPAKDGERPTLRVRLRFDRDPWQLLSLSAKGRSAR